MRFVTLAVLVSASIACAQTFDPRMPDGVPQVSGKLTDQATLRYIDIRTGDGAPAVPGQQYTVHYTGWLRDG